LVHRSALLDPVLSLMGTCVDSHSPPSARHLKANGTRLILPVNPQSGEDVLVANEPDPHQWLSVVSVTIHARLETREAHALLREDR
jgi:hypothetical protein